MLTSHVISPTLYGAMQRYVRRSGQKQNEGPAAGRCNASEPTNHFHPTIQHRDDIRQNMTSAYRRTARPAEGWHITIYYIPTSSPIRSDEQHHQPAPQAVSPSFQPLAPPGPASQSDRHRRPGHHHRHFHHLLRSGSLMPCSSTTLTIVRSLPCQSPGRPSRAAAWQDCKISSCHARHRHHHQSPGSFAAVTPQHPTPPSPVQGFHAGLPCAQHAFSSHI